MGIISKINADSPQLFIIINIGKLVEFNMNLERMVKLVILKKYK